jgi:multidrug efflux pump subunit AcrA (membrane-fusion protein)
MKNLVSFLLVFSLGVVTGTLLYDRGAFIQQLNPLSAASETALAHAKKHVNPRYICPMHPKIVRDQPGECPICGMDLVAEEVSELGRTGGGAAAEPSDEGLPAIQISPAMVNQLGVRTAPVSRGTLARRIEAVGYTAGEVYLPRGDDPAATQVLVLAEVFERHARWVREGQDVEMHLPSVSGKVWKGKVETINRQLDPVKRSLTVRALVHIGDEPLQVGSEPLRPNMYVNLTILADPRPDVLMVPREAVISTGSQHRVILALGEGQFQPREVMTGTESGESVEIVSGLKEREQVVVSAQFLIDSEANLLAGLRRLSQGQSESANAARE